MIFNVDFIVSVTCKCKRDVEAKIVPVTKIIKAFKGYQRIREFSEDEIRLLFSYLGEQPDNHHNREVLKKYPNLFRIKEE